MRIYWPQRLHTFGPYFEINCFTIFILGMLFPLLLRKLVFPVKPSNLFNESDPNCQEGVPVGWCASKTQLRSHCFCPCLNFSFYVRAFSLCFLSFPLPKLLLSLQVLKIYLLMTNGRIRFQSWLIKEDALTPFSLLEQTVMCRLLWCVLCMEYYIGST